MSFLDSKLVDSDFNSFNPVLQILFSIDKLNFFVENSDMSFLNSDLVFDRLASRSIEILSGAESLSSLKLLDGYLGDFLSCDVVSLAQDLDFVSIGFYFFSPKVAVFVSFALFTSERFEPLFPCFRVYEKVKQPYKFFLAFFVFPAVKLKAANL